MIRTAMDLHPEVRAAGKQRQAAEADVRAAYGNYFPPVGVAAMYGWVRIRTGGEPTESDQGHSVRLVVTSRSSTASCARTPCGPPRRRWTGRSRPRDSPISKWRKEVSQTALMLTAAEKSVEASRKGLEQAEEEARIVKERFAAGRGIQFEIDGLAG
jgi:outer membrane protein TolC